MAKILIKLSNEIIPLTFEKRLKNDCHEPFFEDTGRKLRYLLNIGRKYKNLPIFYFIKKGASFMEDEIVLTEEMKQELTNGKEENEDE